MDNSAFNKNRNDNKSSKVKKIVFIIIVSIVAIVSLLSIYRELVRLDTWTNLAVVFMLLYSFGIACEINKDIEDRTITYCCEKLNKTVLPDDVSRIPWCPYLSFVVSRFCSKLSSIIFICISYSFARILLNSGVIREYDYISKLSEFSISVPIAYILFIMMVVVIATNADFRKRVFYKHKLYKKELENNETKDMIYREYKCLEIVGSKIKSLRKRH